MCRDPGLILMKNMFFYIANIKYGAVRGGTLLADKPKLVLLS